MYVELVCVLGCTGVGKSSFCEMIKRGESLSRIHLSEAHDQPHTYRIYEGAAAGTSDSTARIVLSLPDRMLRCQDNGSLEKTK